MARRFSTFVDDTTLHPNISRHPLRWWPTLHSSIYLPIYHRPAVLIIYLMSGQTSTQRLRTKTSDLTDFFRSNGQSSSQSRGDSMPQSSLEVPQSDDGGAGKKKITRIPLFGRTRKVSTTSTTSSPYASTNIIRPSSETTDLSSRAPSADRER